MNTLFEKAETELIEMMTLSSCQKFDYKGTTFKCADKFFTTVEKGQKTNLICGLKANGLGDLIKEDVHAVTLRSAVVEQMSHNDENLPVWLQGIVSIDKRPVLSLRKGKVEV